MSSRTLTSRLGTKEITLNLRLDSTLKAEFMAVTEAEEKSAAEVLRTLMRDYVRQARRNTFLQEAERQSKLIAQSSQGRAEEAEAMRWIEAVSAPLPDEPDDQWFRLPGKP